LAKAGVLPPPTHQNLKEMAKAFRAAFISKLETVRPCESNQVSEFSGAYLRYSSEKSNPRSLVQQLRNALSKANSNKHFIPWQYVFADAGVTGTTAERRGYKMAKAAMESDEHHLSVLYIDEIGRASRNLVDALTLGQLIIELGKRLIGVSDGFDSDSPMSKM